MSRVRTLAAQPVPVLVAAVVAGGAVVGGATALAPALLTTLADWSPAWQEGIFCALLYGLLALVALAGRRLAGTAGARPHARPAAWGLLGIAIGIGGLVLALVDAGLAGAVRAGSGGGSLAALAGGTLVVTGQSAGEELFFRGWVQPVLARRWPVAAAIGMTAFAFAALHVAGGARSPPTLVNLMLGGILFGVLAWRGGGLAGAIGAHAGWNWAEGILFGLDPNPGIGSFGAIHDLDLIGPARWGGSTEGLNASLAMTLVLLTLILPLAFGGVRRVSPARAPG